MAGQINHTTPRGRVRDGRSLGKVKKCEKNRKQVLHTAFTCLGLSGFDGRGAEAGELEQLETGQNNSEKCPDQCGVTELAIETDNSLEVLSFFWEVPRGVYDELTTRYHSGNSKNFITFD